MRDRERLIDRVVVDGRSRERGGSRPFGGLELSLRRLTESQIGCCFHREKEELKKEGKKKRKREEEFIFSSSSYSWRVALLFLLLVCSVILFFRFLSSFPNLEPSAIPPRPFPSRSLLLPFPRDDQGEAKLLGCLCCRPATSPASGGEFLEKRSCSAPLVISSVRAQVEKR